MASVTRPDSPRNWLQGQFLASRHFQPCLTARTVQLPEQSGDRQTQASGQKFATVRSRITMVGTPAMPSTQTLIHAQSVSRDYRLGETVIRAVNDLSLEISTGEFLALLGSSGSGKSTLLNLMAGLDRPTSGAIHVRGQNLAALDSQGLARYRRETVGMVFQSFNLLPRMTLEENVELPLRLAEVDRAERSRRVAQALERVRLGPRRQHRPSELSGGEQQRGALARALVNQPAILFADEPTGNLDSATGEQILQLLQEIQVTLGMTIIMVTHERPLAERFANRIAVLSDGRLVDRFAMQTGARA
jgi:putative ABC transport system ATP-binding protein